MAEDQARVFLRVRPLSEQEKARKAQDVVLLSNQGSGVKLVTTAEGGRKVAHQSFNFDGVFKSGTQEEVFEQCGVKDMMDSVLDGFSCSLFAYGQTGSGKTHTITGHLSPGAQRPEPPGICSNSVEYIHNKVEEMREKTPHLRYTLKASFLEIYNEQVNDLLNLDATNLPLRWNASTQAFFVENLFVVQCDDMDDLNAVLHEGMINRSKASHELNRDSTRGHCIFTIYVDVEPLQAMDSTAPGALSLDSMAKFGKIHFVDLAGSERLKKSKSVAEHAGETGYINNSLLVLGQVISVLSSENKQQHIPYRDSKLTKILMDSLGGNTKTTLLACVSCASSCADETLNTIKFAMRTKNVKNKPARRMDQGQQLVLSLQTEIEVLRLENAFLWSHMPKEVKVRGHPSVLALRQQQDLLRQNQGQVSGIKPEEILQPLLQASSQPLTLTSVKSGDSEASMEALRELQLKNQELQAEKDALQAQAQTSEVSKLLQENSKLKAALQKQSTAPVALGLPRGVGTTPTPVSAIPSIANPVHAIPAIGPSIVPNSIARPQPGVLTLARGPPARIALAVGQPTPTPILATPSPTPPQVPQAVPQAQAGSTVLSPSPGHTPAPPSPVLDPPKEVAPQSTRVMLSEHGLALIHDTNGHNGAQDAWKTPTASPSIAQSSIGDTEGVVQLKKERDRLLQALNFSDSAMSRLQQECSSLTKQLQEVTGNREELGQKLRQMGMKNEQLQGALEEDGESSAWRRERRYLMERNEYLSRLMDENGWALEL